MPPFDANQNTVRKQDALDKLIVWVGSIPSVVLHTIVFVVFFGLSLFGVISWDLMLLILTTIVSLEAIYLAIFIQMTVNRHTVSLKEVEHDIDEIEEDIEDMSEEDLRELERDHEQKIVLDGLVRDVRSILADLEHLKKNR